jgi:predicted ATPase
MANFVCLIVAPTYSKQRYYFLSCLGRRGQLEEGCRYGHLGLRIMDKLNAREWQARVALVVVGGVYFMKRPLNDLTKYLRDSHCAGLVSGDIHVSSASRSKRLFMKYITVFMHLF